MRRAPEVIRRVSAALIVAWLLVLAGFAVRQLRRPAPVARADSRIPASSESEPAVRVHKGFVYSDTVGIEPNFRIAARETLEFVSGRLEMHDVEVTLYDAGEVAYGMTADAARLDPSRREAEAVGNARLSLGAGIAAHASGFAFHGAARGFASIGPVAFAGRGWGGTVARVTGSFADNTMALEGGLSVSFRGRRTAVLLAPVAHYSRRRATLAFPQGVELRQDDLRLQAASASLLMAAPEGALRRLLLEGGVSLAGQLADGGEVDMVAGRVELVAVGEQQLQFVADARGGEEPARAHWQDTTGVVRELAADRLTGAAAHGAIEWLEGQGHARASESHPARPPRLVTAGNLRVEFSGGRPAGAVGQGAVRLRDGDRWAEGEVLRYSTEGQSYVLQGLAGQPVRLGGTGFSASCDLVEGARDGRVAARGRVAGKSVRTNPDGSEETVHFAGELVEASASEEDPIVLQGNARLWQQDRLIRAERLEYFRERATLRGAGEVLSIATFDRGQEGVEEAKVRARAVSYDRNAGEASYEGDVELVDPRAVVRCQRLVAQLDEGGNVRHATLSGGVSIVDTGTGRSVEGQRATFDPGTDLLDIWGTPVLAREANGSLLKAHHFRWYRGSATFVVVGEEDNPSEALYHAGEGGKALPLPRRTPPPPRRRP